MPPATRPWSLQLPDNHAETLAAGEALARGLARLGHTVLAPGSIDPSGPVALLNHSGGQTSGRPSSFSWRCRGERLEIFADSPRSLGWGVYDFLEFAGLSPPPWPDAPAFTGEHHPIPSGWRHARALSPERTAVFVDVPPLTAWAEWARALAFTDAISPADHVFLALDNPGAKSLPLPRSGSRSPIFLPPRGMDPLAAESAPSILKAYLSGAALFATSPLRLLYPAEGALAILEAARDALRDGLDPARLPHLVLDDGLRCRVHALGDPACTRNAPYSRDILGTAMEAWAGLTGAAPELRLRHDDDGLFPAPPPALPSVVAADTAHALALGASGLQFVVSTRLAGRASANARSFSRACFEREGDGLDTEDDPGGWTSFISTVFGAGEAEPSHAMRDYFRDMEGAWGLVLDRGAEGPLEPMDPWDEAPELHEARAEAYQQIYAYLDEARRSLEAAAGSLGGHPAYQAELTAFTLQEAAIELSGSMRALYCGTRTGDPAQPGIFLIAEAALIGLEQVLRKTLPRGTIRSKAMARLYDLYGRRLETLSRSCAWGPLSRLRTGVFNALRRWRYRLDRAAAGH